MCESCNFFIKLYNIFFCETFHICIRIIVNDYFRNLIAKNKPYKIIVETRNHSKNGLLNCLNINIILSKGCIKKPKNKKQFKD